MMKRKNGTRDTQFIIILAIAAVITSIIALLNNYTPAEPHLYFGTVIYPYMRFGVFIGIASFVIMAGFCLRLTLSAPTERFKRSFVIIAASFGIVVASSGHLFLAPTFLHLDSMSYDGNAYHLARIGYAPQSGDYYEWVLVYECDARGILCENVAEVYSINYDDQRTRPEYIAGFNTWAFDTLEIQTVTITGEVAEPKVIALSAIATR